VIGRCIAWLDKELAGKQYLMGDKFTVANAYLFTALRWSPRSVSISTNRQTSPLIVDRVAARQKVQEALKAEGLQL
jgi:glutathione S-transferase